jgi:hypothetical protein
LGAVIGKNPGSALPIKVNNGLSPFDIGQDRLLPTLNSVIVKSFKMANQKIPENSYVQVLNLFYLCSPDLDWAVRRIIEIGEAKGCVTEKKEFPWVWYMWGNGCADDAKRLNPYKRRFRALRSAEHFFLDKVTSKVVWKRPCDSDFAKHLQGLPHVNILPSLASLITSNLAD